MMKVKVISMLRRGKNIMSIKARLLTLRIKIKGHRKKPRRRSRLRRRRVLSSLRQYNRINELVHQAQRVWPIYTLINITLIYLSIMYY